METLHFSLRHSLSFHFKSLISYPTQVLPNSLVKVFPERAKVAPEEVLDVEVTFTIAAPGLLATILEVEVRGSKPLKMPLK